MRNHLLMRFLSFLLVCVLLLPLVVACGNDLEENEIKVKWRRGFVGSDLHETDPLTLVKKADGYSYTDVITVPEKGTVPGEWYRSGQCILV